MRNAFFFVVMLSGALPCFGAEVYPSKSVRVIVPYAPGGSADLTVRVISQQLSEQFGKTFIIDNRPGASAIIGTGIAAKSAPDGYTLLGIEPGFTVVPGLNKSLPYDPAKDFTPITEIIGTPHVLVVNPSLNVRALGQFVALAQANPGKFNFGSGGAGGTTHLAAELFKIAAKVNVAHIPYKGGGGEVMTAMLNGQIQMVISPIPTVLVLVKNGKLRALAVTTDGKRTLSMPDVPSMSEAGVSGMVISGWTGLVGPAAMPKVIVNKLHAEVVKALAVPSVADNFIAKGAELVGNSPEEFSRLIRSELRRWAEVIKSAGITPE